MTLVGVSLKTSMCLSPIRGKLKGTFTRVTILFACVVHVLVALRV